MTEQLPTVETPKQVAAAAATVAEREADFAAAELAVKEATASIETAKLQDREAFARAKDEGRGDPGAKHLDATRARLADTERIRDGEQLRLERAQAALDETVARVLPAWESAIVKRLAAREREVMRALDRFDE